MTDETQDQEASAPVDKTQGKPKPGDDDFTNKDVRAELKGKMQDRDKAVADTVLETDIDQVTSDETIEPTQEGDPIRAAYLIVVASAVATGFGGFAMLRFIDSPSLGPTAQWAAPLLGAFVFLVISVFLARSSTVRPK